MTTLSDTQRPYAGQPDGSELPAADRFDHPDTTSEPPLTVIEPRPGWRAVDLGELWRYRELLFFLVWRDVKVRYKQTALGAAWAVIQPLLSMIIFSVVLGRVAAGPSTGVPYPLFVFAGMLAWTFFANAITSAAGSVVGNQAMVSKIYFPRLLIPVGAVGAGVIDLAIGFVLLLAMMPFFGVRPGWGLLLTPPLALGLLLAALGVGVLLSALTVAYRDFKHAVPFLIQAWMFATPAIYLQSDAAIGHRWRPWLPVNPAHGLIANFRNAALGRPLDLAGLAMSSAVGLALLAVGLLYFRRVEREFADII